MKVSEAKTKVCPILSNNVITLEGDILFVEQNCICDDCIYWESTISGKKEIDRQTEPYDMTPMGISDWIRRMEANGYVNIGRDGGFRDVYVKYEEAYEGYCKRIQA